MGLTFKNPAVIGNIQQTADFFTTKEGTKHSMEQKTKPFLMFKSVPFSLCNFDTIITDTRTIYFSCYRFVYNIQVKIF